VRFFIIRAHYRSALNYSDAHLRDAKGALKRLYTALASVPNLPAIDSDMSTPIDWAANDYTQAFKAAMDEDFGTPGAIAVLFDLAAHINKTGDVAFAQWLRRLGGVLGLLQTDPQQFLQGGQDEASSGGLDIEALIAERAAAKAAKNFARADEIRQELLAVGVVLKDSPTGTTWERA